MGPLSGRSRTGDWKVVKHWRSLYHTGDLYQDAVQDNLKEREEWEVPDGEAGPYLWHVKHELATDWPYFRALADFMEVGTDPARWRNFDGSDRNNQFTYPRDEKLRKDARSRRLERVTVRQIIYNSAGDCLDDPQRPGAPHIYVDKKSLSDALSAQLAEDGADGNNRDIAMRLFVVEDLSREVIEQLGYHFDIEPDFFRAHIYENAWYNVRDPFYNPPTLSMDMQERNWFQLRFVRVRYFDSRSSFDAGQTSTAQFNIVRKLYDDENKAFWDTDKRRTKDLVHAHKKGGGWFSWMPGGKNRLPDNEQGTLTRAIPLPILGKKSHNNLEQPQKEAVDAKVGYVRSKATFWMKPAEENKPAVAVLLLDPTVKDGWPLWRWYRSWEKTPGCPRGPKPDPAQRSSPPTPAPGANLRVSVAPTTPTSSSTSQARNGSTSAVSAQNDCSRPAGARKPSMVPPKPQAPTITRRKGLLDEDRTFFNDFVFWAQRPDSFLRPKRSQNRSTDGTGVDVQQIPIQALLRLILADWLTLSMYIKTRLFQVDWEVAHPKTFLTEHDRIDSGLKKLHTWRRLVPTCREMLSEAPFKCQAIRDRTQLEPFRGEFEAMQRRMDEYQARIDQLTSVVTAAINIADSRDIGKITVLATLFAPLSLVGTLFSMSDNISEMRVTFGWWALASATCLVMMVSYMLTQNKLKKVFKKILSISLLKWAK